MSPLLMDLEQLPEVLARLTRVEAELADLRARVAAPADPDQLVDVKTAAAQAGTTADAIYKLVLRGRIPKHPIGTSRRYRLRLGDVLGAR